VCGCVRVGVCVWVCVCVGVCVCICLCVCVCVCKYRVAVVRIATIVRPARALVIRVDRAFVSIWGKGEIRQGGHRVLHL